MAPLKSVHHCGEEWQVRETGVRAFMKRSPGRLTRDMVKQCLMRRHMEACAASLVVAGLGSDRCGVLPIHTEH